MTTDTEVPEQEGNQLVHELPEGPQSPIEALRAKRDEVAAKRDVLIPIIGYEQMGLKCKYRLVDRHETENIAKRVRVATKGKGQGEFMFLVLIDTIIAACEGFYIGENDEPLMNEAKTGHIESYAAMAAELKGEALTTHRNAVLYVFGENDFAVGQHGLLLNRWLGNTNIDIDEEALGE